MSNLSIYVAVIHMQSVDIKYYAFILRQIALSALK